MNAKKHDKKIKSDSIEFPDYLKYFFTIDCLSDEIIEYTKNTFEKDFSNMDLMNVAIFTLHGIVFAETDDEKEVRKRMICEMIDNKYNLNEWLFSRAKEIQAYNDVFYNAYLTGNTENLDEKVDKAVAEANYKAWNDELDVIMKYETANDRKTKINGCD